MRNNTIENRAVQNAFIGFFSFFLSMAQVLISVPVLLSYWGKEVYGIWLALFAGFTMLQTIDSGHQNYVGNEFNMLYHADKEKLKEVLGSSMPMAYFLGLIELFFCIFLITIGYLPGFLGVTSELAAKYRVSYGIIILMIMWLLAGSLGGIIVRLLIPVGMLSQAQWWGILNRFTQFLSLIGVAVLGGGLFQACVVFSFVQLFLAAALLWYIRKKLPEFYPWWGSGNWRTAFGNFRKSLALTFNGIAQQLSNNGLVVFVSALFGAVMVPAFTTIRTLTNTASAVTAIFISSLMPDMVRFHSTRSGEKLVKVFDVNWFISGMFVNIGIIAALPVIERLYVFWTKGILPFDPLLFFSLAVAISFFNFGSGLNVYIQSINDLKAQIIVTFTRIAVLFLSGYLLGLKYGIAGVGMGCVAAEIFSSALMPVLFVNRRLADFCARLEPMQLRLALLPPIFLFLAGNLLMIYKISFSWIAAGLTIPFLATYYYAWKNLDEDVRCRLRTAISSGISAFSLKF